MLHARLDLITADPPALGECITYIDSEVRPAAESHPGSGARERLGERGCGAARGEQGALAVGAGPLLVEPVAHLPPFVHRRLAGD